MPKEQELDELAAALEKNLSKPPAIGLRSGSRPGPGAGKPDALNGCGAVRGIEDWQ